MCNWHFDTSSGNKLIKFCKDSIITAHVIEIHFKANLGHIWSDRRLIPLLHCISRIKKNETRDKISCQLSEIFKLVKSEQLWVVIIRRTGLYRKLLFGQFTLNVCDYFP